jgi:hypothetical protein
VRDPTASGLVLESTVPSGHVTSRNGDIRYKDHQNSILNPAAAANDDYMRLAIE